MPPPTLLVKGSLVATKYQSQDNLNKYVPIEYFLEWINARWKKEPKGLTDRVLAINSKTGSGKSTALPAAIVMKFLGDSGVLACTQPRRLTAIENPKGIAREPAYAGYFKLGENIGWSTGVSKLLPNQGLLSMTVDTLTMWLRTMTDEEIMSKLQFILIDEAHERSKVLDITLYMLKAFMIRNQHNTRCPFVFMLSATFDPVKYAGYFGLDEHNVMNVEGLSYPKEENWAKTPSSNYVEDAANMALKLHTDNADEPETADILVFMPGMAEIAGVEKILDAANKNLHRAKKPVFMLLKLSAEEINRQSYSYQQVMAPHEDLLVNFVVGKDENLLPKYDPVKPVRRIVLTTIVAETGLTIDTLKYVIDCGWTRGPEFNPTVGMGGIITAPPPQSRVIQRKGRVGRKFPGKFYATYTEDTYSKLMPLQYPNILTDDISDIFLDMVRIQAEVKERMKIKNTEFRIEDIDMLDSPPVDSLMQCLEKNYLLGFIAPAVTTSTATTTATAAPTYTLTKLGEIASKIAMPGEAIRTVLAGFAWDVSTIDLITMMAYIYAPVISYAEGRDEIDWLEIIYSGAPNYITTTKRDTLLKLRLLITDDFIEGLFLYHTISRVMQHGGLKDMYIELQTYCNRTHLKFESVMMFLRTREEFIEAFINADVDPIYGKTLYSVLPEDFMDTLVRIKYCIYDGFRGNIATYDEADACYKYRNIPIATPPLLSESEYNYAKEQEYGLSRKMLPKKIMFSKILILQDKTNKELPIYKATTSFISAIDGFINSDSSFI